MNTKYEVNLNFGGLQNYLNRNLCKKKKMKLCIFIIKRSKARYLFDKCKIWFVICLNALLWFFSIQISIQMIAHVILDVNVTL